ncbi:alpha/beta hydrolase [Intrasporangium sp. YIM S08009]|uniref:alpha/beta hydrolase n=1 Tax=Intrasporangium zincisolvens TaxID=3080018 RepID=UPI002B055900|nr:alpha/beta hydrolase [Intrasporangium sp. YIM S08009]
MNRTLRTQRTRIALVVGGVLALVVSGLANGGDGAAEAAGTMGSSTPIRTVKSLANGQTVKTFRYHTQSPDEIGDVYYNRTWVGTSTKRAAVIVVHGGWWHNADRAAGTRAAQKWLDSGFVVFNIDYRVAADHAAFAGSGREGTAVPGARWPAQRTDVALAYDWFKANAAQFNVDPRRVALYGFSAGGHLVNSASGYYGTARFRASASVSGIQQPKRTAEIVMNPAGGASSPMLVKSFGYMTSAIGCSYEPTWSTCGAKWRDFQPESYFGATKPAIYAAKGTVDPVEPIAALQATDTLLTRAGQRHLVVSVTGRGHDENIVLGTGADDVTRWKQLLAWMRSVTA